jgi:hypothetical protein
MTLLAGKTAVITGGSSGIGLATARQVSSSSNINAVREFPLGEWRAPTRWPMRFYFWPPT